VCYGNTVSDCSWAHVVYKDGSQSTNFGPLGKGLIYGNTFRGSAGQALGSPVQATRSIDINNGYVKIFGNTFDRIYINDATGNPYVVFNTAHNPEVEIVDNTFYECLAANIIGIAGSGQIVRGNRFYRPLGPESNAYNFRGIYYYGTNAASTDVVIEDNEFLMDDATLRPNASWNLIQIEPAGHTLHNLSIRRNKFNGYSGSAPTENGYFINAVVNTNGHKTWIIDGNTTDGGWRGASNTTMNYISLLLGSATVWPLGLRRVWDFGGPLDRRDTDGTLAADESGFWVTNAGAAGTEGWDLPAALPGMEFTFSREAAFALRARPNGSNTIGDGGAGKYLELTHYGTVRLKCITATRWTIDLITAWNDPGAAGTPTPGWLWQA
jgi:hypothetical protein